MYQTARIQQWFALITTFFYVTSVTILKAEEIWKRTQYITCTWIMLLDTRFRFHCLVVKITRILVIICYPHTGLVKLYLHIKLYSDCCFPLSENFHSWLSQIVPQDQPLQSKEISQNWVSRKGFLETNRAHRNNKFYFSKSI